MFTLNGVFQNLSQILRATLKHQLLLFSQMYLRYHLSVKKQIKLESIPHILIGLHILTNTLLIYPSLKKINGLKLVNR